MTQLFDALFDLYTNRQAVGQMMRHEHEGQGLVEYGLLLLFIALAVIIALIFFGERLTALYSRIGSSIPVT